MMGPKEEKIALSLLIFVVYLIPVYTAYLLVYYMKWWVFLVPIIYILIRRSVARILDKNLLKDAER